MFLARFTGLFPTVTVHLRVPNFPMTLFAGPLALLGLAPDGTAAYPDIINRFLDPATYAAANTPQDADLHLAFAASDVAKAGIGPHLTLSISRTRLEDAIRALTLSDTKDPACDTPLACPSRATRPRLLHILATYYTKTLTNRAPPGCGRRSLRDRARPNDAHPTTDEPPDHLPAAAP
jgi:hypothetical protein